LDKRDAGKDEFQRYLKGAPGSLEGRGSILGLGSLRKFLNDKSLSVEMERDFVDVSFSTKSECFIGEIKVTRNLTLAQRSALHSVSC
jgi:hypothetical protein